MLPACTAEPPVQEAPSEQILVAEQEPYFYQPPADSSSPFGTARLKYEDQAEAFMNRFRAISQGSILIMQQEKMVLQERSKADTARFLCVDPLFPAYVSSLLARLYQRHAEIPHAPVPLDEFFPTGRTGTFLARREPSYTTAPELASETYQRLIGRVEKKSADTYGMAAEELLFEPLEIDAYQLKEGQLCVPPQALLQLSSLWLRKGRWNGEQFLSEAVVKRVMAPAYATEWGKEVYGWQYYRLRAKGRKQPVLFWEGESLYLFLLPELEAAILIRADEPIQGELWELLQQYMIPALFP
ncbi:hypothetical protein ADICEAN_03734 [Cesiribacter andamanensis AMV16]|uniref:Beta-lactamase n=1 Tax=Cesiribacter andamanensis AMV16 TaxID=1279009 RepID=M7NH55_9BACT|nr:hypothetical protein ADICEAN_03734 [Cesiribacter andamanensis AMV16]